MTDQTAKSGPLRPTRKARRKRLEINRMRSMSLKQEQPTTSTRQDPHSSSTSSSAHCYSTSSSSTSPVSSETAGLVEKKLEEEEEEPCTSNNNLRFGHVSVMGRRRSMEDVIKVAPPDWLSGEYSFFAVYDGHGGAKMAETCGNRLDRCLEKHVMKAKEGERDGRNNGGFDWERIMVECFRAVDEELMENEDQSGGGVRNMGTTALVVLVGKEEFVVANCGDSRAVLCRNGAAVAITSDHKPDRDDEKERIEAAGGRIINWNGWRVQGILATSRSLGDQYLKPYVSSEPEVTVLSRLDSDEFLIMASDGLFDVVCNNLACEVVKRCLSGRYLRATAAATTSDQENVVSEAAAALAELAIAKGSRDNVSVIVVQFK